VLRFVHLSDTHITFDPAYEKPYARRHPLASAQALIDQVKNLPFTPDFILHTGDIAYDPYPELYPQIQQMFAALPAPVIWLAGNHDDRLAVQTTLAGSDTPQQHPFHDLEINGVQLILVDSNANAPQDVPRGLVPEAQMEWLDTLCAADDDRPLVIAVHHNVVRAGVPWLDDYMRIQNGDELHAIIRQARDRLRGVFHGHIHQNLDVLQDGVLYSAAASSWCGFMAYPIPENDQVTPDFAMNPGFSVVTITPDRTTIRRHFLAL
jgi:Icc protein